MLHLVLKKLGVVYALHLFIAHHHLIHAILLMLLHIIITCLTLQLVMEVLKKLEGAYALLFKSRHYPGEMVACKRGSPLILGIKVGCAWVWVWVWG